MSHISAVETAMKLTARKPAYEIEWVVEGDIKRTANSRQGDDGFECLVRWKMGRLNGGIHKQ